MKKLWIEDIELNPACLFQETTPATGVFIDKTSDVVAWYKYGRFVLDFDRYRYEMKAPFYGIAGNQLQNWASLSAEIKSIGAEMFFIPYALRLTVVSEQQDIYNWERILTLTQGTPTEQYQGRAKTFDVMRICVAHKVRTETMTMTNSQQMLKDVGQLVDWYIRVNAPDFKAWLTNEVGTIYENDGFAQKAYYSLSLKDELYNIYNGDY